MANLIVFAVVAIQAIAGIFIGIGYGTNYWYEISKFPYKGDVESFHSGLWRACIGSKCESYDADCDTSFLTVEGEDCAEFNGAKVLGGLALFFGVFTALTNTVGWVTKERRLMYSTIFAALTAGVAFSSALVFSQHIEKCIDDDVCEYKWSFILFCTGVVTAGLGFFFQLLAICCDYKSFTFGG